MYKQIVKIYKGDDVVIAEKDSRPYKAFIALGYSENKEKVAPEEENDDVSIEGRSIYDMEQVDIVEYIKNNFDIDLSNIKSEKTVIKKAIRIIKEMS